MKQWLGVRIFLFIKISSSRGPKTGLNQVETPHIDTCFPFLSKIPVVNLTAKFLIVGLEKYRPVA